MIVLQDEPAFVIHKRPYHDSSTLVQFLTPSHGRVTVVARVSAKMVGKTLQPFIPASITCGGRGQLMNLRQFDPEGPQILTTVQQRMLGMYVNELLVKLTPAQVSSRVLFEAYAECIAELASVECIEKTLRIFELRVLELTGNGLQLFYEYETGQPLVSSRTYRYDMDLGVVQADRARSEHAAYSGRTFIALREQLKNYDKQILAEAKHLLKEVIDHRLEGKLIETRNLFAYLNNLV